MDSIVEDLLKQNDDLRNKLASAENENRLNMSVVKRYADKLIEELDAIAAMPPKGRVISVEEGVKEVKKIIRTFKL